jgi:hypothetical protein
MDRISRLLCITGLVASLAQARAMRHVPVPLHKQHDAVGNSDISLYITTDKILATSPLLQTSDVHRRVPVDVVVVTNTTIIAATSTLVIAADSTAPLYDWVAQKITASSDANSCSLVYGTDFDGEVWEGYAYQTISMGFNSDTTATCEDIRTAVGDCADRLHEAHAVRGCCRISYGGTWSGQLRLTAEADGWPSADC